MTQLEKLKEKIRARPPEARFDDVRRLLELNGWTMKPQKGTSHVIFKKPGQAINLRSYRWRTES